MKVDKLVTFFLPTTLFIADRVIKYLAPSISVEGDFLSFGFYKNYAGAFSLPIGGWMYNIAGIILLIFFIYLFYMSLRARSGTEGAAISSTTEFAALRSQLRLRPATLRSRLKAAPRNDRILLAYCFIILGGLSNMIDRLIFGYTIDYINLFNFSFFNIADGMLVAGIGVLLLIHFKK